MVLLTFASIAFAAYTDSAPANSTTTTSTDEIARLSIRANQFFSNGQYAEAFRC